MPHAAATTDKQQERKLTACAGVQLRQSVLLIQHQQQQPQSKQRHAACNIKRSPSFAVVDGKLHVLSNLAASSVIIIIIIVTIIIVTSSSSFDRQAFVSDKQITTGHSSVLVIEQSQKFTILMLRQRIT